MKLWMVLVVWCCALIMMVFSWLSYRQTRHSVTQGVAPILGDAEVLSRSHELTPADRGGPILLRGGPAMEPGPGGAYEARQPWRRWGRRP